MDCCGGLAIQIFKININSRFFLKRKLELENHQSQLLHKKIFQNLLVFMNKLVKNRWFYGLLIDDFIFYFLFFWYKCFFSWTNICWSLFMHDYLFLKFWEKHLYVRIGSLIFWDLQLWILRTALVTVRESVF